MTEEEKKDREYWERGLEKAKAILKGDEGDEGDEERVKRFLQRQAEETAKQHRELVNEITDWGFLERERDRILEEKKMLQAMIYKMMDSTMQQPSDPLRCFMTKITKDGRITIPSEFREIHNLKEGDIVQLMLICVPEPKKA